MVYLKVQFMVLYYSLQTSTKPLFSIANSHSVTLNMYADDCHLYVDFDPKSVISIQEAILQLQKCIKLYS